MNRKIYSKLHSSLISEVRAYIDKGDKVPINLKEELKLYGLKISENEIVPIDYLDNPYKMEEGGEHV